MLQVLVALGVAGPCYTKLISDPGMVKAFDRWGYPHHFYLVIGVLELCAILAILIPRLASYAAAVLLVILFGACTTLIFHDRMHEASFPFVLAVFATHVLIARWPKKEIFLAIRM